jgi:GMP synthase (glutamine-hydrolysing)
MTPVDIHAQRILVLDFGGQYTQLIARRVREAGVYCEIHPWDMDAAALTAFAPRGVILSGGPESVTAEQPPVVQRAVLALGVPVLGICYGMQSLAQELGGRVSASSHREYGHAQVRTTAPCALLDDLANTKDEAERDVMDVWMSHGDRVDAVPEGFAVVATTANAPIAAMADESRGLYGLQFHPEVTHTYAGQTILSRFLHNVCGCAADWNSGNIIEDAIDSVRAKVGDDEVLLGLSGGVDSSVVAALLHRAIGDKLTCVFVDTGLLRHHEGDEVMAAFAEHMGVHVIRVNAAKRFFDGLRGVADPEDKRKVIGRIFIEVFDEEAARLPNVRWLAQGTIYPDVIESAGAGTGKAHVIKSHHNVGGLPEHMKLSLVEPLRELFKDEVRRIGLELGLPPVLIGRHPFPGPGLGVRILGEVRREFADILRAADAIFIEELRRAGLYDQVSQAFAVFLPVKSVAVMGDGRVHDYVIALRAVETVDFMTARSAHLPYDFLDLVSRRIINEIKGVSRVAYDISSKPPATIEWE